MGSTCTSHMKNMSVVTTNSTAINNAISTLHGLHINLLAIDFDQTFIDIHTGGKWPGTVDELFPHVRPEFQQLVRAVLQDGGGGGDGGGGVDDGKSKQQQFCCKVCIVTFSCQPQLIRGILELCFGIDIAHTIPIRGGDRSWTYTGNGSRDGKQAHIASAVEELLANDPDIDITKATTLLIDDDMKNIRHALKDGTRAIWFNPQKPYLLLQDIAKLI